MLVSTNTVKMNYGEAVLSYINPVRLSASVLTSMGVDIEDFEVGMTVLNGLPELFNFIIIALDEIGKDWLSLERLKRRLLQEKQKMLSERTFLILCPHYSTHLQLVDYLGPG